MNCPTCKLEAILNTANGKDFYFCGECRVEVMQEPEKSKKSALADEYIELLKKLSMTTTTQNPCAPRKFPRLMTREELENIIKQQINSGMDNMWQLLRES